MPPFAFWRPPRALESGDHTADIYRPQVSQRQVGTTAFTDAIIARLGERPKQLEPVQYQQMGEISVRCSSSPRAEKQLVGVDVFLDWSEGERDPQVLGKRLESAAPRHWQLKMITNRGVKVYPDGLPETYRTDHWRCRFVSSEGQGVAFTNVLELLKALDTVGLEVIKTEHLYLFGGERGYSLGQGE